MSIGYIITDCAREIIEDPSRGLRHSLVDPYGLLSTCPPRTICNIPYKVLESLWERPVGRVARAGATCCSLFAISWNERAKEVGEEKYIFNTRARAKSLKFNISLSLIYHETITLPCNSVTCPNFFENFSNDYCSSFLLYNTISVARIQKKFKEIICLIKIMFKIR